MITIPHHLTRAYCEARPRTLFIFATDRSRCYHASESAEMEGLRNAFWLPVKLKPCMDESAFFVGPMEVVFEDQLAAASTEFNENYRSKFLSVIPNPKFGQSNWTGPMSEKTPKCWKMVQEFFAQVQTPHEIDWRMKP